jgi:hypothetical protein
VKALVLAMVAGTALAVTCSASAAVKTIVLVHGAFSDGSGWKPVADILERDGRVRCGLGNEGTARVTARELVQARLPTPKTPLEAVGPTPPPRGGT